MATEQMARLMVVAGGQHGVLTGRRPGSGGSRASIAPRSSSAFRGAPAADPGSASSTKSAISIDETASRLGRRGRQGPPAARALLAARRRLDGLTESGFETRLVRVLRNAGLPEPTLQHEVHDECGRHQHVVAEPDFVAGTVARTLAVACVSDAADSGRRSGR